MKSGGNRSSAAVRLLATSALCAFATCANAANSKAPVPTPRPTQQAQQLPPNCGSAMSVSAQLQKEGLAPIAAGFVGDNVLFTIYASADRTAWVATTTNLDGVSCAIATGHTWMSAKPQFPYAHGRADT